VAEGVAHRAIARAGSFLARRPPEQQRVVGGWLHDGCRPEEAGELAGDGDGGDVAGLAATA